MQSADWRRCVLACLVAVGAAALPARADSADDVVQLRQEAARMRVALEALEARIRALEAGRLTAQPGSAADTKKPVSSYATLQRNWSGVEPGTSKARVEELLGKPERELHINGDLVWYFVYPDLGRGSVFFDNAGKVAAVQPPRVGWFW